MVISRLVPETRSMTIFEVLSVTSHLCERSFFLYLLILHILRNQTLPNAIQRCIALSSLYYTYCAW